MSEKIEATHTLTGKIVTIPAHYLTHPTFSKVYVVADERLKPYEPTLYRPKSAEEFKQSRKSRKEAEAEVQETEAELNEIEEATE